MARDGNAERWRRREIETAYKIENSGSGTVLHILHRRSHGTSEGNAYEVGSNGGVVAVDNEEDAKEMRYKMKLGEGCAALRVVDRSKRAQKNRKLESSWTTGGIAMLLSGGVVCDEVAEKMKNMMKLKADVTSRDMEIRRLEEKVGVLKLDQERYRKNVMSLGEQCN